jgi:hypothetical protein
VTIKSRKRFSLAQATAPSAGEMVAVPASSVDPGGAKPPVQRGYEPDESRRLDVQTSVKERRIAFTWRLSLQEADKLEALVFDLRHELGRRRLDRATVLQALVDLASEGEDIRACLTKRLDV